MNVISERSPTAAGLERPRQYGNMHVDPAIRRLESTRRNFDRAALSGLCSGCPGCIVKIIMRLLALTLAIAVGPIGPTLCDFRCASSAMTGRSSSGAPHDMAHMPAGHAQPSAAPGPASILAGGLPCSHFDTVPPSILRTPDFASFVVANSVAEFPITLRVDLRAIAFHALTLPSESPPSYSPPVVSLRI